MSTIGHNSENVAADQLRLLIQRIQRLEEEKKGIGDDIKDCYLEGKATGFDTKQMRRIIRDLKRDAQTRQEEEAIYETYAAVFGLI